MKIIKKGEKMQNKFNFFKNHYLIKTIFYCLIGALLIACGDTELNPQLVAPTSSENPPPSRGAELTLEERKEIATNLLFEQVVDNKPIEEMEQVLLTSDLSIYAVNQKGDTVLGTAIQMQNKETALFLLEKFQCDDLSHQNKKGESYLYLSAKEGYESLIHGIADKCYENSMFNFSDYEFSDLDPETETGEIAIHTALNGSTTDALEYEYDRGTLEYSWFPFYKKNKEGQTFLHTAAKDNRVGVIKWAVDSYCEEGEWERSHTWWKSALSTIGHTLWNGLQTWTFNIDQLINEIDTNGNTALHLASQALNTQGIRLLSHCRWTEFLIENKEDNIALQMFLSALDPKLQTQEKPIKDTFVFLVNQKTYFKKWTSSMSDTVDHQNNQGDSALHIAARLNDPFFYNHLKSLGDIYLKNDNQTTPQEIFQTVRNTIQNR